MNGRIRSSRYPGSSARVMLAWLLGCSAEGCVRFGYDAIAADHDAEPRNEGGQYAAAQDGGAVDATMDAATHGDASDAMVGGDASDAMVGDDATPAADAGHEGGLADAADVGVPKCGFGYKRSITIAANRVGAVHTGQLPATGFPALIKLSAQASGNWLKTRAADAANGHVEQTDGSDIVFEDAGGARLFHELERYDGAAGALVAWVRIDNLSKQTDTTITMLYGDPCIASPTEQPQSVWDASYRGVWHLSQDERDSTSYGNHGESSGSGSSPGTVAGAIAEGRSFDGSSSPINVGSDASLDDLLVGGGSVEAWINPAGWGQNDFGRIVAKALGTWPDEGWAFMVDGSYTTVDLIYGQATTRGAWGVPNSIPLGSRFYHVVVSYDASTPGTNPVIYIDGASGTVNRLTAPGGALTSDAPHDMFIGGDSSGMRSFDGIIDEVRVSDSPRDLDWVRTAHSNQSDPGEYGQPGFYAVGDEAVAH